MNKTDDEEIPVHASSGNIFADLGRPDAEEAFARVRQLVQLEELRREIQKGIDSSEATPWDTEQIKREGRQRRLPPYSKLLSTRRYFGGDWLDGKGIEPWERFLTATCRS